MVVGGLRDPHFGPAVTIGLGGVAAEVFNDTVTVLAPPEPGEVESAVSALRGAPLLHGYRGAKPIDLRALKAIVHTVADALTEHDDTIEIDCNPVVVTRGKPVVVDAPSRRPGPADWVSPLRREWGRRDGWGRCTLRTWPTALRRK